MIHGDKTTRSGAAASVRKWRHVAVGVVLCIFVAARVVSADSYWSELIHNQNNAASLAATFEQLPGYIGDPPNVRPVLGRQMPLIDAAPTRKLEIARQYCLNKNYHNAAVSNSTREIDNMKMGLVLKCAKAIAAWSLGINRDESKFPKFCCVFDLFRLVSVCRPKKPPRTTTTKRPPKGKTTTTGKPDGDSDDDSKTTTTTTKEPKGKTTTTTKKPRKGSTTSTAPPSESAGGSTTTTTGSPTSTTTTTTTADPDAATSTTTHKPKRHRKRKLRKEPEEK